MSLLTFELTKTVIHSYIFDCNNVTQYPWALYFLPSTGGIAVCSLHLPLHPSPGLDAHSQHLPQHGGWKAPLHCMWCAVRTAHLQNPPSEGSELWGITFNQSLLSVSHLGISGAVLQVCCMCFLCCVHWQFLQVHYSLEAKKLLLYSHLTDCKWCQSYL